MSGSKAPATADFDWLAAELDEHDATGFVHVGHDSSIRYCTGYDGATSVSFVYTSKAAVLCLPTTVEGIPEFSGRVRRFDSRRRHPGQAAASVLDEQSGETTGTVLVPPPIPHDAALYLEEAGYELASSDVVERVRREKTGWEQTRTTFAQGVAVEGVDRAHAVLAEAERSGDRLLWDGELLTATRLRGAIDEAMVAAGGLPSGTTRVGIGGPPETPRVDVPIPPAATVTVEVAPREPAGYHGHLTRTLVVDGDGGWNRRAHVAVTNARSAALATLDAGAGVTTGEVHRELVAELGAYGFDPSPESGDVIANLGHGVGLDPRESPPVDGTAELPAGTVLAIRPGLATSEHGYVAVGDLILVDEDGARPVVEYPPGMQVGD